MGVFDLFKKKSEPESAQPQGRAGQGGAAETPAAASDEPATPGWFGMLRAALKKTTDVLNTDIRDLFKREGRLVDDEFLGELFAILVKTDMGTGPAARIRDRIGTDFRARVVHMEDVLASVKDEVRAISHARAAD
jgi:fused signal recognition particle receptor